MEWKAGHLVLKPFTGLCKQSPDTVTWPPGPAGPGSHLPCIYARPHGEAVGPALSASQSPHLSQAKIIFSLLCPPKLPGSAPGLWPGRHPPSRRLCRLLGPQSPVLFLCRTLSPTAACCCFYDFCLFPWFLSSVSAGTPSSHC